MAHVNIAVGFEFWIVPVRWELKSNLLHRVAVDGEERRGDAWKMRDEFFRVKAGDIDAVLRFLNRWGLWFEFESISLNQFWNTQHAMKRTVMGTAEKFFENSPQTILEMRGQYPHFLINAVDIVTALDSTITLDFLRRVRFRLCARTDCRTPFAVESKHVRKFCSQYCGHLESVRRIRRKQKRRRASE